MVELPVGTEVLRVLVQGEIDIPPVAFNYYRVPVMVVQETATRHRRVAEDRAVLIATCCPDSQITRSYCPSTKENRQNCNVVVGKT